MGADLETYQLTVFFDDIEVTTSFRGAFAEERGEVEVRQSQPGDESLLDRLGREALDGRIETPDGRRLRLIGGRPGVPPVLLVLQVREEIG